MRNEYGARLDKNGYAPSIVQPETEEYPHCWNCLRATGKLDRHEVFGGARRSKSKRLGLWVLLCPACHAKAHGCRDTREPLQALAQARAMQAYGWTENDFIQEFGESYI